MTTRRQDEARARLAAAAAAVDRALFRLLQQGLQRLSRSSVDELGAVAQTAHAAGMIRVEREIETLRTHITRYLDADPLFRTADLLASANRIWLMNRAVVRRQAQGEGPAEMVTLLGEARRRYEPVEGPLSVQPLAANGWLSPTGFLGITVHLDARFATGERRRLQASTARPSMAFGTDPRRLLHLEVSAASGLTLFQVAHTPMILRGARLSADGRLALGGPVEVGPGPDGGLGALAELAVPGFGALVDRLRDEEADVLGGGAGVLAYVEPARWGALALDEKRARARMAVWDRAGAVLWLQAALAPQNNQLLDNLEAIEGNRPRGVVGWVMAAGGELRMEPYTAIYNRPWIFRGQGAIRTHRVHLSLMDLARGKGG